MAGNRQVFSTAMSAADRYRWDSQWTEAAQEYQRALAEFPEDAAARGGLGFCYMQTKQWQQALDEYEYILKRDLSNVIALSKTAELYVILGQRENGYKAYLHLADLYSQAGQGSRAEAAWQKAVQLSPGNPEPHERLATYYLGKKDIPSMIAERLAAAQGYLQRNDRVAARMQCEEVLRADTNNTNAKQLLSRIMQPSGPLPQGAGATFSTAGTITGPGTPTRAGAPSDPLTFTNSPAAEAVAPGNTSGGNTGIMGNMGSAGNFGGVGNPGSALPTAGQMGGGGAGSAPRKRITASQVTGVLRQAQTFQTQGRFNDAIDLCEQILESGFDRPDARYFLGWLYQEQQRWDEAIQQFQMLLNDPDYALSCYYALGQCYRARGDLRTASMHFDEAVDRVNLDALTVEESDQLVQLCQEAAESHRLMGEQDQALTVYNALLGFLRSRGWGDKVAQVEFMLQQVQNAPVPPRPITPMPPMQQPQVPQQQAGTTRVLPPEQTAAFMQQSGGMPPMPSTNIPNAATMAFNVGSMPNAPAAQPPQPPVPPVPPTASSLGELPDWLTGILNDADKTQIANKHPSQPPAQAQSAQPPVPEQMGQTAISNQPTIEQRMTPGANLDAAAIAASETRVMNPVPPDAPGAPVRPPAPTAAPAPSTSSSWLTEDAKPGNVTRIIPPEQQPASSGPLEQAAPVVSASPAPAEPVQAAPVPASVSTEQTTQAAPPEQPSAVPSTSSIPPEQLIPVQQSSPAKGTKGSAEELLSLIAGSVGKDEALQRVAKAVLASTASLPENVRMQVIQSMQDIQKYIEHGLLTPATEECLRVIDMAPQYLDVHQVLCEIYVRQGKVEQAITKYAILIDTYIVNGRIDDAIATYRRILQLDPNNLTYRMRLINLLSSQGNKEDLLHERTLAAESYLRLGYMDRAVTELEQALQESPTSVPTRLNYALALQKLGRTHQAVAEYQRVLQVDPRNITALVRWHISTITGTGSGHASTLEVLNRIRWQLRGEGQRNYEPVVRDYLQTADIHPNNADIHFALGQIHQQAGAYDKAIDSYHLAMRDSSYEVMARTSTAHCLLAQGKPEAAIQQLEQALQSVRRSPTSVDPGTWAARPREEGEEHRAPEVEISLLLAKAYRRAGREEQAQAIMRQVKQTTTHRDEVTSAMAEISARQGDVDGTLQEYTELVRQYRSKRQTDSAIKVLNEMVRLALQDPRAHAELGDIYMSRGLLEEGIAELRLLADIYLRRNQIEEAGATLRRVGNIYAELGNTEEAMANLRRAAELTPNDMGLLREVVGFCLQWGLNKEAGEYQIIIARHYFDTQQVKETVAALQQLITIDRSNYEAYDMLGQTYQTVGEYEQASRVYKNLAKVNPDSPIARERLVALQELRAK